MIQSDQETDKEISFSHTFSLISCSVLVIYVILEGFSFYNISNNIIRVFNENQPFATCFIL